MKSSSYAALNTAPSGTTPWVADLPAVGKMVRLLVCARRFHCDAVLCGRRIFAERFDDAVLAPWARRTARLDHIVHCLGLALGGRPAARFACRLMAPVSNDTILRVVRRRGSPPAHALVISIDEKSQIQALDRTQPGLPLKKGRGATLTHDYKRNGTTTLFAALDVLTGEVCGRNMQRHRHQEFIRFLNALERDIPAGKVVHVILDNYAAHKHEKVRSCLDRHPRWTFHFTPTTSSWLNAVEGFIAILTRRRLQHGVFLSVVDLQAAINRFIDEHNQTPKPFVWRADPDVIIAARNRGLQALESIQ
ncbi:DDE superfamily endonuclease [Rhodoblastus acidophilus]|uniref:DDE superfamily endonuclease n=1 Tax=Rhodoblastus acidophilus TaxID=1074 RepID=A0A212SE44_RHOAC|nr:DDE superfamily endonuclease [Rhodoblastus acidophilus]